MRNSSNFIMCFIALFSGLAHAQSDLPARISFIFDGGESYSPAEFDRALNGLESEVSVRYFSTNKGGEALLPNVDLRSQELVFIDGATDALPFTRDQIGLLVDSGTQVVVVNDNGSLQGSVDLSTHAYITEYWENRSIENDRSLTLYLLAEVLGKPIQQEVNPPIIYSQYEFYHPAAPTLFTELSAYQTWYAAYQAGRPALAPDAATVGIIGHLVWVQSQRTEPLDAMIEEIEARGQNAITLVHRGAVNFRETLMVNGQSVVDVLLFSGEMLNYKDPAAGRDEARQLGVPIVLALTSHSGTQTQYRESPGGLAPGLTARVVYSERDGLLEPLVVATRSESADVDYDPWQEQLSWRIDRALAWAKLRNIENQDKRVVLTYWSEAGGRADVGGDPDDFLDVPGSASALLKTMRSEGYDTGNDAIPGADELARMMAEEASNIGGWASGRLDELVANGGVITVSETEYLQWFNALPEDSRTEIEDAWGPAPGQVMVHQAVNGEKVLVIPRLQFGNIILAPHPMWGYYENEQVLMSTGELPPHHQYLAFFLWMQKQWQANAWVSLFTNLTLMPGKSQGPLYDDHVGILLGSVPHIHPERLGANGGPATRRKTLAQPLGWYNVVVPTAALGNYAELGGLLRRYYEIGDPQARLPVAEVLRDVLTSTGLALALPVDVAAAEDDALVAATSAYLEALQSATAPWGGRILGSIPEEEARLAMVGGMLGSVFTESLERNNFDPLEYRVELLRDVMVQGVSAYEAVSARLGAAYPDIVAALTQAAEYSALLDTAPNELSSIMAALNGKWIEPGLSGEAYRNPEVLPPGRSVFGFDPSQMPTIEAEAIGIRQAEALVATHREKNNGEFPQELAFVLWSGELAKSHGVTEAQILHLLGVRATRNWRGQITGVELIPRDELGRPRIDVLVTTSGVYRDQFQDKADLIAEAVALAAASQEDDNNVMQSAQSTEQKLLDEGEEPGRARQLALARVFAPAPGAYSPSIQFLAKSGDLRGDESRMAELYASRMSHAYGNGLYGQSARDAFNERLLTMNAATLSRSSDVNGLLDHPMSAAFLGGLNLAAKALTGNDVDLYVSNIKDPGNAFIESASAALQRELQTRYLNPDWLKENMEHGYDGARNFMFLTDHMDLWDSTATELVTSDDWDDTNDVFINDRFKLGIDQFFDSYNPYAQQVLMINLLGASMRGDWQASEEQLQQIAQRFLQSVEAHGPACDANQCRNAEMTEFIASTVQELPDAAPGLEAYLAAIAAATGGVAPRALPEVEGQRMEQVYPLQSDVQTQDAPWLNLWIMLLTITLLILGWYIQGRREQWSETELR